MSAETIERIVHLGLIRDVETIFPPRDMATVEHEGIGTVLVFMDGDSFLTWGESVPEDGTAHIVLSIKVPENYQHFRELVLDLADRAREMFPEYLGRLADYAVVSSPVWSEEQIVLPTLRSLV